MVTCLIDFPPRLFEIVVIINGFKQCNKNNNEIKIKCTYKMYKM